MPRFIEFLKEVSSLVYSYPILFPKKLDSYLQLCYPEQANSQLLG